MQQKKLCTYYKYAVLHPDHGRSNHNGGAVHLHKSIVQGHHTIIYMMLVRFFNLHVKHEERNNLDQSTVGFVKKEVVSQVPCELSCSIYHQG